jgi:hypothetical protein
MHLIQTSVPDAPCTLRQGGSPHHIASPRRLPHPPCTGYLGIPSEHWLCGGRPAHRKPGAPRDRCASSFPQVYSDWPCVALSNRLGPDVDIGAPLPVVPLQLLLLSVRVSSLAVRATGATHADLANWHCQTPTLVPSFLQCLVTHLSHDEAHDHSRVG